MPATANEPWERSSTWRRSAPPASDRMSARPLTPIALIASPGTQTALWRRLASSRPTVVLPDAGTPEITNSATLRSCHALPPFSSPPSPYGSVLAESLICEVGGRAGGRGPQHPGLAGQQG